ncbi:hypothetical protein HMPREF1092_02824 [Clostridium thermobutyricum]|uniref:Uncharacterized protein n=1 Tax=Clostridium thermobutyricum TaxID=29372 RepID=N9XUW8_9CLOT|nr:hypothetical protein HMPREF1092_02824 [Clostridium thermobutyricum]
MKLSQKCTVFNIIKFLCFAGIVIVSFGNTEMSFKNYIITKDIREIYIIFSIIISFFIGNLFIKFPLKKKILVFIITMLVLYFIMKFRILFMGISLCTIYMYISFELSIIYFIDFFTKEAKLFYIVLVSLNFLILIFICVVLTMKPLV